MSLGLPKGAFPKREPWPPQGSLGLPKGAYIVSRPAAALYKAMGGGGASEAPRKGIQSLTMPKGPWPVLEPIPTSPQGTTKSYKSPRHPKSSQGTPKWTPKASPSDSSESLSRWH